MAIVDNYIYVGKLVSTHGIKGEIKILSNFSKKELIFKNNGKIYIGENKEEFTIINYRVHKNFDMLTLNNINNINEVLEYIGKKVYVLKSDLNYDGYIYEDLIGFKVFDNDKLIGEVIDFYNDTNPRLYIKYEKNYYIPLNGNFIKSVDINNKEIITNKGSDLII